MKKDKEIMLVSIDIEKGLDETEIETSLKSCIYKRDIRKLSRPAQLQLREFMRRHDMSVNYAVGVKILPSLLTEFNDADDDDEPAVQQPQTTVPQVDIVDLASVLDRAFR